MLLQFYSQAYQSKGVYIREAANGGLFTLLPCVDTDLFVCDHGITIFNMLILSYRWD